MNILLAHIPFAHHTLQSVRSDGCPIDIKQTSDPFNSQLFEIEFRDIVRGKSRLSCTTYMAPSIFSLRSIYLNNNTAMQSNEDLKSKMSLVLLVLVAPIAPGRSRAFLSVSLGRPRKLPLGLRIPKWFIHGILNKFLDSDVWIHGE